MYAILNTFSEAADSFDLLTVKQISVNNIYVGIYMMPSLNDTDNSLNLSKFRHNDCI